MCSHPFSLPFLPIRLPTNIGMGDDLLIRFRCDGWGVMCVCVLVSSPVLLSFKACLLWVVCSSFSPFLYLSVHTHILIHVHTLIYLLHFPQHKCRERQQGGILTSKNVSRRKGRAASGSSSKEARTTGTERHTTFCILTKIKCVCSFILHSA